MTPNTLLPFGLTRNYELLWKHLRSGLPEMIETKLWRLNLIGGGVSLYVQ